MPTADQHRKTISKVVDALRAERERKQWSKYKLANMSGISLPAISLIEAGKREPNMLTLLSLAKALELRLGDLLNRFEDP